jgi:hypothetical protein
MKWEVMRSARFPLRPVNEFYKKGCQGKTLPRPECEVLISSPL